MDNNFNQTVGSLFKGMDGMLTTKTVVGEPINIGDVIILPLVDVNFGMAAGAFSKTGKDSAGGGMGGKMSPSAVLVIQDGRAKMVSVKESDTIGKIIEMVPEVVDKIGALMNKDAKDNEQEEKIKETIDDIANS